MSPLLTVFLYSLLTAVCTGLGALPFALSRKFTPSFTGKANAIAASLMLAASFGLIYEWLWSWEVIASQAQNLWFDEIVFWVPFVTLATVVWLLCWLGMILLSDTVLSKYEHLSIDSIKGADAKKIILILGVMTLHSFSEWIAVGVSFGPSMVFGVFIAIAIAIHNIPEWLAISAVMVPRGMKRRKAWLRSIFSSLPQPLMAIPAFLFVQQFVWFLPIGLGFAAGAMIRMSFAELLPDAMQDVSKETVATIITLWIVSMILFQSILGV